jgi:hypothetical protein
MAIPAMKRDRNPFVYMKKKRARKQKILVKYMVRFRVNTKPERTGSFPSCSMKDVNNRIIFLKRESQYWLFDFTLWNYRTGMKIRNLST